MESLGDKLASSDTLPSNEPLESRPTAKEPPKPVADIDRSKSSNGDGRGQWEQIDLEQGRNRSASDNVPVIINTAMIASAARPGTVNNQLNSILSDAQQRHRDDTVQVERAMIQSFMAQTSRRTPSCFLGLEFGARCCSLWNGGCAWLGYSLGECIGRVIFAILWDSGGAQVDNISLGLVGMIFGIVGVHGLFNAKRRWIMAFLIYVLMLSLIFFFRAFVWCAKGHTGTWILGTLVHNGLSAWEILIFWKLYRWAEYFQHGGRYDETLLSPP